MNPNFGRLSDLGYFRSMSGLFIRLNCCCVKGLHVWTRKHKKTSVASSCFGTARSYAGITRSSTGKARSSTGKARSSTGTAHSSTRKVRSSTCPARSSAEKARHRVQTRRSWLTGTEPVVELQLLDQSASCTPTEQTQTAMLVLLNQRPNPTVARGIITRCQWR